MDDSPTGGGGNAAPSSQTTANAMEGGSIKCLFPSSSKLVVTGYTGKKGQTAGAKEGMCACKRSLFHELATSFIWLCGRQFSL